MIAPPNRRIVSRKQVVAHVLPWPTVGGVERGTLRIFEALEGSVFENLAYCPGNDVPVRTLFSDAGFEVSAYDVVEPSLRRPVSYLRATWNLARSFRRHGVDLVHAADLLGAYYAAPAARIAGIPILCHIRCRYPNVPTRHRPLLTLVDRYIFVSRETESSFGFVTPLGRSAVIYDGVNASGWTSEDGSELRRELGIPAAAPIIGMVARVAPAKDYETLIRAAGRVLFHRPDARFVVVGDHSSAEPYRQHYARVTTLLRDAGLLEKFVFTGFRPDPERIMSVFDVFVLCTNTEGLPLVLLEAMNQGKPVVATSVGGIPELVTTGRTGLLHAHADDQALAAHLLLLLEEPEYAYTLGRQGQHEVQKRFSMARFRRELEVLYGEVLAVHSPQATTKQKATRLARRGRR